MCSLGMRKTEGTSKNGYVVFDDTVIDKNFSHQIELVRRQYSGNAHGVIKGIGVVNCVYVNPETEQFWIIDFRIYDPAGGLCSAGCKYVPCGRN